MNNVIVLDYTKGVTININEFPIKNLHGYWGLRGGIFLCANSVRAIELKFNQAIFKNKGKGIMGSWNFTMSDECTMVYNLCNWFSINLVSFFRLVTLLRLMKELHWQVRDIQKNRGLIKSETEGLLKEIAPDVLFHRNKVAAHLAATDPYKEDSEATLLSSLISNVGFSFPYYSVTIKTTPQSAEESQLPTWNLTQVYERLTPRFWPDALIPKLLINSHDELIEHQKKFYKRKKEP